MNPANIVDYLIKDIKERLTLDGKNRVFYEGKELSSEFMKEKAEPEAFTKEFLIDKILDALGLEKLPERSFETPRGYRSVDYRIKSKERMFLVEAKPLNADLFEKGKEGGVNQIKGLFTLAEVQKNHAFGVATNGLRWIFIDRTGEKVDDLGLEEDFEKIKEFLVGREKVVSPKTEEEISKKFYDWYNALLHGGRYKDHENKLKTVSEADCLVNNVIGVRDLEEREQIAQVVMNRLIFIKFLQSKGIIGEDILRYLSEVKEDLLTPKLRQLFFGTLDRPEDERFDIDERFKGIPYLNGSLFVHTEVERKNIDYKVRAEILKKVIEFLDSFKFVHKEQFENEDSIDPEILGYIFERAMTATDRKGTGAYYTPKPITRYISENTIYPYIIDKTNEFLKTERGYKEGDLLMDIKELFILAETTLNAIWNNVILKIRVLDNACGSGAFLLAAANILFDLSRKINDKLGLRNSDVALKKLILINNLHGVDINPNGIEIAKLRLWLWLVDSYEPERVEPLPNIDYNLRVGNSLIGYVDISELKEAKFDLLSYFLNEEEASLDKRLNERNNLIQEYKRAEGEQAKELKGKLNELDEKINDLLNANLYKGFREKKIKISKEEFLKLKPFHWGFEFYEVFDLDEPKEERGFDVVIGNPPWIQSKIMDALEKNIYKTLFKSIGKQFDSFNLFIERSMVILNRRGQFSYIVPNRFLANPDSSSFRKYLLEDNFVRAIVDVGEGIFVGVTMPALLLFLNKENNQMIQITTKIQSLTDMKGEAYLLPSKEFLSEENCIISIYLTPNTLNILREIERGAEKFGKLFSNARGVEIGKKSRIVSDIKINEDYYPFLVGEDIDRYIIKSQHFIKLGIRGVDYKDKSLYFGPKILIRKTGRGINATIDYTNRYVIQVIYIFKPKNEGYDARYFLLLLNSKLLKWYYLNKFGEKYKQVFPHLRQQDVLALPTKIVPNQHLFITFCDYMLFLNETEERRKTEKELIEFIDKQIIDSLVYELYFKEKFEEDGLKTNLLGLVVSYLKDSGGLKSDEEKLKVIKEVVEKIKGDREVMNEIERIKSHEWVRVIEG